MGHWHTPRSVGAGSNPVHSRTDSRGPCSAERLALVHLLHPARRQGISEFAKSYLKVSRKVTLIVKDEEKTGC